MSSGPQIKALRFSTLVFSSLFMLATGMRLALPGLLFGIPFVEFVVEGGRIASGRLEGSRDLHKHGRVRHRLLSNVRRRWWGKSLPFPTKI